MKTIRRELNIVPESFMSVAKYLPSDTYAVFDIETTGLSASFSTVILSGFVLVSNGKAELIQYFAETPMEEKDLLMASSELISSVSYLVTYNGKYFDVPFINKRCARYGIEIKTPFNLDLYNIFKYYSPLGKILPKLGQKDLEEYAGIAGLRQDKINGEISIDLYENYQLNRSPELERQILLHNSDDVEQLLRLMSLIKNCDMDRAFFKSGFPIEGGLITDMALKGQDLIIKGFSHNPVEYIGFPSSENPLLIYAHKSDGTFEITAPCEAKEKSVYIDLLPFMDSSNSPATNAAYAESQPGGLEKEYAQLINCAGFVNNYLILKEDGTPRYSEISALAKYLASITLKEITN